MYFGHLSTIPSPLKFSMHTLNGDHMASLFKSVSSKDCFHGDDCRQLINYQTGDTCISYSILGTESSEAFILSHIFLLKNQLLVKI